MQVNLQLDRSACFQAALSKNFSLRHSSHARLAPVSYDASDRSDIDMKQLKQLDLLILDELGYVPTGKAGAELLFDVLSTAYERQSLIVTTNLPFEQWTEVLGSERLTGAALDRLTHRCHILEAKGESYRLKDARRRQRRAGPTA